MTSAPERRRSLGMRVNQFQRDENRRVWRQAHRRQILAGKVQLDSFLQVATDLVERWPLGDNWNLETLRHIAGLLPGSDHCFDRTLKHFCLLPTSAINWAKKYACRHSTEKRVEIARNALPRCYRRRPVLAKPPVLIRAEEVIQ